MAYMSEEGYQKLVAELRYLESVERPKVVAAIAEARDKGDLSENAEYDAAKEAQGLLEMKINLLPFLLIKKPTYKFRNKSASLGMDISDGNASAWNPCRLLDPLHTKIQDM